MPGKTFKSHRHILVMIVKFVYRVSRNSCVIIRKYVSDIKKIKIPIKVYLNMYSFLVSVHTSFYNEHSMNLKLKKEIVIKFCMLMNRTGVYMVNKFLNSVIIRFKIAAVKYIFGALY